jgi:Uma2 family endonuclease
MSVTPPVETRRWKRVEYDRMIECGIFDEDCRDNRLELIDGLLVLREPKTPPYAATVRRGMDALTEAFGAGFHVRSFSPVALDDDSEPEPDLSVVRGAIDDYVHEHPARPVLIVEVALTSLAFDREFKSSLYARAGVTDYWVLNLVDEVLEVRRGPVTSDAAPYGWTYERLTVLGRDDFVTPLAAPMAVVQIADLLPQPR